MAKVSLKDRIEGNELDLSLNELAEVPVLELAGAAKATHVDLSCNKIKVLPNNFAMLTHLVKIDLSQNQLTELPHNFGNLTNLQHLDLYKNNISMLPISFCRLKNLRWLDLKDNPLDSKLKAIAGDCLDKKQCQACAKNVVSFMQSVESELERQKQKKLKEQKIKEAERLEKEAKELAEQRKKKKEEREKRKAEAKLKAMRTEMQSKMDAAMQKGGNIDLKAQKNDQSNRSSCGKTCVKIVLSFFLMSLCTLTCYAALNRSYEIESFNDFYIVLQESYREYEDAVIVWWKAFALPYFLSMKESVTNWVHSAF